MGIRIKHIIVITDHGVDPGGYIQRQFEGADPESLRLRLYDRPADLVPAHEHVIDRVVYPVKMAFRVGAGIRIAYRFITEADLLLCRKGDHLHLEPLLLHRPEGLLCGGPCDGLGGQVKDLVAQSLTYSLNRREHGGDGFADAGGRLDEKLLFPEDCAVHGSRHVFLPGPVGKGKFTGPDRGVPLFRPFDLEPGPFLILSGQIPEPLFQLFQGIFFCKSPDLLCVKMTVGHLHADPFQAALRRIHIRVTFRLRKMHRNRLFDPFQIPEHAFDLVDQHFIFFLFFTDNDAVRPAFHPERESVAVHFRLHRNFRMIVRPHAALDLPVETAAHEHRFPLHSAGCPIVNIPASQNEFHKIPD